MEVLDCNWIKPPGEGTSFAHGSSLLVLPGGTQLAAWFGGSWEARPDCGIYLARREPGHTRWGPQQLLVSPQGHAHGNAVLFSNTKGIVFLAYFRSFGHWCADGMTFMKMSTDDGVTWSKEQPLFGVEGVLVKNKPYLGEGGLLLLPVYDEKSWRPGLCRSEDGGRYWRLWLLEEAPVPAIQGSIVTDGLGTLHMFLRTRVGRMYDMTSHDDGQSWAQPGRTNLLNPNSGLDALGLSPGKIMIVYNASRAVATDILDPVQRDTRTPLTVALSEDRGQTWHNLLHLEQGPGEYSYPAVVRDPGGTTLHISYTYRRKAIRHVVLGGI